MGTANRLRELAGRLRQRFGRLRRPSRSRGELHDYWKNPTAENAPELYLRPEAGLRSEFLVRLIQGPCSLAAGASVLEIGCNAGRNLQHLFGAGFRNLTAIEINEDAIALLGRSFPDLAAHLDLRCGPVESVLPEFPPEHFDLVFTMAVLEHIHDDSASVFAGIARVCRGFLITIEDEHKISWRHFPRDYRKIFEPLGLTQILEQRCDPVLHGLGNVHVARVFRRAAQTPSRW